MATNPTIQFKRKTTSGTPSSLALGEPAVNTSDNQLFIGVNSSGVKWMGAEIENSSTNGTTWTSDLKLATKKAIGDYFMPLGGGLLSGDVTLTGGSDLRFRETGGGTDYVAFQAPASIAASVTWTLPSADGSSGEVLSTNGSGTLSWASAGSATTVTTNSDNTNITRYIVFGSSASAGATLYVDDTTGPLSYNPSTGAMSVIGNVSAGSVNKVTITAPATGSTLTITDGKTLSVSNTLTFTGTDSSSVAFGAGGTVLYNGGALGTPSSGTLSSCTGLPVSTGISGLGTGIATFLGTPSSANLAAAVTDETGTGSLVLATSPALTTPSLSGETFSTNASVTAGTDAQGQAALTSDYNVISNATNNPSGVTLPTATTGRRIVIVNKGANAINVYPASGASIDALSTNASIQIPVNGVMVFNASSTTKWYSTGNSTFTAPVLGTPVSGTLTNCTGLPVSSGISGLGSGVATFLATPSSANLASAVSDETGTGALVFANTPTLVTPILGTPQSGTLSNCTGLPVSSGISGLGSGVATFLATPSSANLINAISDETGSGALVFANTPTLVTPILGTPTSGTLSSCTGLPVSTGISGLGTGVATFLATPSSANLASALTDESGSGAVVFTNSPTLVTPTLGVASATSINKVTITSPATGSTLTISDGKTLTVSNSLTFTGTDSSSVAFGAGGTVLYNGGALGTPSSGTLSSCTGLPVSTGISGLGTGIATFLGTPSSANLAAAVTDETGTGALVFANSPSFTTPALGNATATAITATSSDITINAAAGNNSVIISPTGTGTVSVSSKKITNLATPFGTSDAATKGYVDSVAAGLNYHPNVHGATTTNLSATYDNGTDGVGAFLEGSVNGTFPTLDGETMLATERVLVKDQSTQTQNGIYYIDSLGSGASKWKLIRATDANNNIAGQVAGGDTVFVEQGSSFGGTSFVLTGTSGTAKVLGTDALVYTQFAGVSSTTAGQGLVKNLNALDVNVDNSTIEINSDTVRVKDSGITNAKLANSSVTVNGTSISLGSSGTVTANTTNTLTIGTGLSGTSFNGSASVTIAIDTGTVVTLTGIQTLTNKTLTSPTLTTPILGTPSSGTLSSCTGLPVSTGISGLGTGIATFLGTPSSANLAAAVTDETGSGALVFATSPSLTTPAIGSGGFTVAGSSSGTTTFLATAAASGTITFPAVTGTVITTGNLSGIGNAAADGSTKGIATFNSTQFDDSSGLITLDTIDGGTYA